MGIFILKPLVVGKIKSVFRDVKWCFSASWGLKGLTLCVARPSDMNALYPRHDNTHDISRGGHCLRYDSTYAWCVKLDAWSVMHDAYCTWCVLYVKMWCVMRQSSFCWRSHPVRISCGFLHTGTWHLIYLNISVSISIASAIVSQMFPTRICVFIYSINEASY